MAMETKQESSTIHQILIKLLNGKHKALNFTTPIIPIEALKNRIQTLTLIPSHLQLLTLSNSRVLSDSQSLNLDDNRFPVVVHLLLRLRGGKGGFGSLLRGAATKAGQKKTNNFDACRDMSGRRLRHVNAEKKLEEWRAEADERKLERVAEEYIKKKDKETGGKKARRSDAAEKYVAKYREDSAKCMEEVERTVRESLKGVLSGKRKGVAVEGSESDAKKRMKIWLGKRKVADSDSEDEDDSDDDAELENEKSIVIDNGNNSDSSKEAERSPDSVTGARLDIVSSDKGTSDSGSEEEKDFVAEENLKSGEIRDGCSVHAEAKSLTELEGSEQRTVQKGGGEFCLEAPVESGSESRRQDKEVPQDGGSVNIQESVNQLPVTSVSGEEDSILEQGDVGTNSKLVQEETVSTSPEVLNLEKPLNFDEYNTATELEVLGMERLKSELLARGLKCGGTLQERAARLFLLKTTPLEKLPKKLFAKK